MPQPKPNETSEEFIERCVRQVLADGAAASQDQAVAICHRIWEEKEMKEQWTRAYINDLPDSAFLYIEPGGEKDEEGKTTPRSKRHLPYKNAEGEVDLPHLRNAISRLEQPRTGGGEDGWLSETLRRRLLAKAQRILASYQKEAGKDNAFLIWKDKGSYRWLAIYSNRYRDEDWPPEILSSSAHLDFVRAVDSGEWSMPELRLWHVKGTRCGAADWIGYDDSGFSLASGLFDPERQAVAERLAQRDDLLVSHGMPVKEILRDAEDPTVILRYRSEEISVLPAWAAANPYTGFRIFKEETMSLPEEKRAFLAEILGEEAVTELEAQLAKKATELESAGVDFKGTETGQVAVSAEELAKAVADHLAPILDRLRKLEEWSKELAKKIEGLEKSEEEKLKDMARKTPAASLYELITSAIGDRATEIDGRSSLAKSKPQETKPPDEGPTPSSYLNWLIRQQYGGTNANRHGTISE